MNAEILIAIALPLLLGMGVWGFFQRDLRYFQAVDTLKIGEIEALAKRHRQAISIHLVLLLVLLPLLIFRLENYALLAAILLAAVFWGHLSALNRLSRPLIAALKSHNTAILKAQDEQDNEALVVEAETRRQRLND